MFHDFATPGDQIERDVTLDALRGGAAQVRAEARHAALLDGRLPGWELT